MYKHIQFHKHTKKQIKTHIIIPIIIYYIIYHIIHYLSYYYPYYPYYPCYPCYPLGLPLSLLREAPYCAKRPGAGAVAALQTHT